MNHQSPTAWSTPGIIAMQDNAPPMAGTAASGTTTAPGGAAPAPAGPVNDGSGIFMMIIPIVLLMLVFSVFSQRRDKKRRQQMLGGMKKHDSVRTIGGVIGAIVELNDDTVVLKVDESSNTRMTFTRDAIQQIVDADDRSVDTDTSES
jgi:preprotein translocase subunit YajC